MELKPQFDELQKIFDRCIKHACRVLEECIATKTARLDPDQRQEQERLEYNRIADELAELYLHHSVLSDLRFCYSEPAFLWEGGFFEALHADEKKKYLAFSVSSFDYSQYERDNTAYDAELPYFSAVVNIVVRERHAGRRFRVFRLHRFGRGARHRGQCPYQQPCGRGCDRHHGLP